MLKKVATGVLPSDPAEEAAAPALLVLLLPLPAAESPKMLQTSNIFESSTSEKLREWVRRQGLRPLASFRREEEAAPSFAQTSVADTKETRRAKLATPYSRSGPSLFEFCREAPRRGEEADGFALFLPWPRGEFKTTQRQPSFRVLATSFFCCFRLHTRCALNSFDHLYTLVRAALSAALVEDQPEGGSRNVRSRITRAQTNTLIRGVLSQ